MAYLESENKTPIDKPFKYNNLLLKRKNTNKSTTRGKSKGLRPDIGHRSIIFIQTNTLTPH